MSSRAIPAKKSQARPNIFEQQAVIANTYAPVHGATHDPSSGLDPWHGLPSPDQPTPVESLGIYRGARDESQVLT